MDRAESAAGADDGTEDERDAHLLARQEPVLRRLIDDRVHREREEVPEHDLDNGTQAGHRRAERGAGEGELRDGRVEDALRPYFSYRPGVGRRRRRPRNVLAEEDHPLVDRELLVERVPDRGAEGDRRHQRERAQRPLEQLAAGQEAGAVGAVDDPVVAAQRERHHVAEDDPSRIVLDRRATHRADGQNRRLLRVDDRSERAHAEHPEVGDGERPPRSSSSRSDRLRAPSTSRRVSAAISARLLRSASETVGTSSASSTATAMPTLTRE